jgi:hypothetical protein
MPCERVSQGQLWLAVAMLLAAPACSAASGPAQSSSTSVAGSGHFACPVTPGVSPPVKADPTIAAAEGMTFGRGPVFAVIVGARSEIIPFPTPWPDGIFANKVAWMANRSYKGKVAVTGRRLDGPGKALFGYGVPPDRTSINWSVPGLNGNFQPSAAGVSTPGCYEWDVVGDGFSFKIVFNATVDRM